MENGSTVEVFYKLSDGQKIERTGKVIRFLGNLEQAGRMARLIVEIDDPFNLKKNKDENNLPMFLNTFVHVRIHGSKLTNVVSIDRGHLHEGSKVWIMNNMHQLEIRKINVLWKRDNDVLISTKHLKAGEMLITSKISTPVQNMQLRTQGIRKQRINPNPNQENGKSNFGN